MGGFQLFFYKHAHQVNVLYKLRYVKTMMMTSCKYTCQMKMLIRLCWSITCLLYMQVTLVTQTIVLILYKVCVYSRVKTLNVMSMIFNYLTASQQFQYYSDTDDDWDHQLIPYSNIVIIISKGITIILSNRGHPS